MQGFPNRCGGKDFIFQILKGGGGVQCYRYAKFIQTNWSKHSLRENIIAASVQILKLKLVAGIDKSTMFGINRIPRSSYTCPAVSHSSVLPSAICTLAIQREEDLQLLKSSISNFYEWKKVQILSLWILTTNIGKVLSRGFYIHIQTQIQVTLSHWGRGQYIWKEHF